MINQKCKCSFLTSGLRRNLNKIYFFLLLKFYLFLFLAVLDPHDCVQAFSSCGDWRLLSSCVRRLLITVASLCTAQALGHTGFSSYGEWA